MTNQSPADTSTSTPPRPRRSLWRRLLKWTLWIVGVVVLIILVGISAVVFYLSPDRLTHIVNRYASEYLDAQVDARRVELTFWSTFPRVNLAVDSLRVVSHSLSSLPASQRASLPADADSLASLRRFSGGINLLKLLGGTVELYDVELADPRVNLLVVNDSINNFDIVPKSEPSTEPTSIPKISINRFSLVGDLDVRYRMPADSVDLNLRLSRTLLAGNDAPVYTIGVTGDLDSRFPHLSLPTMPFSVNGRIDWDADDAERLRLNDFRVMALDVSADFNADIMFADTLRIDRFELATDEVDVARLMTYLPAEYAGQFDALDTDLTLALTARILKPYRPTVEKYPDAQVAVRANASRLLFDKVNLHRIILDAEATTRGDDLNDARLVLRQLSMAGKAMEFTLSGEVTNPVKDPRVEAEFDGSVTLHALPKVLMGRLPMRLSGVLTGQAKARFALSQLTPKRFHKAKIDGHLTLKQFAMSMHDGSLDTDVRCADLRLGTSSSIKKADLLIDSMLTASLRVDTASFRSPGVVLTARNLNADLGMRNVASSSDTTQINPIGGTIKVGLFTVDADHDQTRIRFGDAIIGASLRRYEGNGKSPLLNAHVEAARMALATKDARGNLRGITASVEMHPRSRRGLSGRLQQRVDSLAQIYPDITTDSLVVLARRGMRRNADTDTDGRQHIDFHVDRSFGAWMKLWDVSGELSTRSGRAFSPYFPTRTRLSDLKVGFSTDSVIVHNMKMRAGHSDFSVNGAVRNIRRAVTSSRRHTPIEIEFNLLSDTIDVNDIMATMLRGAAYSKKHHADSLTRVDIADDLDDLREEPVATAVETGAAALLVPSNVSGRFSMRANNIHYGELWLTNFVGGLNVFDGAVALDELRASTDMGSIDLTALYSAPRADDIHVAAGLRLNNLNLHSVLSEMPQVDSLLPMLRSVEGIVNARMALTADFDSLMNLDLNSVDLALQLQGDSLVILDSETFRTVAKWLMFKNKHRNMIDHMDVEITVHKGWVDLYPVIFDMDRYRFGIVGNNDMHLNLDYHVAVLKSPLPFKFGVNIKGTPEKLKIRLGKARLNERSVASSRHITDSLRINLISEMSRLFRRGVRTAGVSGLRMQRMERNAHAAADNVDPANDMLDSADSLILIQEGIIEAPQGFQMPGMDPQAEAEARALEKKDLGIKPKDKNKNKNKSKK